MGAKNEGFNLGTADMETLVEPLATSGSTSHLVPVKPEGVTFYECWTNLWLLAIMGGFLAIICVSSNRFVLPEPGTDW